MSSERTAWHPPFTTLLRERGPRWAKVTGEPQLTQEPMRVDDLIELRVDVPRDPGDHGNVLRGLWPQVRVVALVEFKSVSRPFRRGDLARLLSYGLVWFYAHQSHDALTVPAPSGEPTRRRGAMADLTLALVTATVTPTLVNEVAELGLSLTRADDGYHRANGGFCTLLIIELSRAAEREHDELMAWFAGRAAALSVEATRWIGQNTSEVIAMDKASPDLSGYDDWIDRLLASVPLERRIGALDSDESQAALDRLLASIPVEKRLAGLDPEEVARSLPMEKRLAGLDPEEVARSLPMEKRLAGLDPEEVIRALPVEHRVLALPDDALAALSEQYVATLPDDVQAAVRARLRR